MERKKIKTLIVDDEPLARRNLRVLLEDDPEIEIVAECGSGPEALEVINDEPPDLLFLDIQMPEMSGFEVLRRLKEDPVTANIPVVILTSKHLSPDERQLLAAHATRILSKQDLAGSDSAESLLHALSAAGVPQDGADG